MCKFAVDDSACFQLLFETVICCELKVAIAGMEIDNYNIDIRCFNPLS